MSNPSQSNPDRVIMSFGEFLADAKETDLLEQVADEIALEQREPVVVDPGPPTEEEWGVLAHQMCGGSKQKLPSAGQSGVQPAELTAKDNAAIDEAWKVYSCSSSRGYVNVFISLSV